ncbi:MAG: methyltransferase [Verrucomicrobia bacterium]|nr:methyltransferase [Verrucomicrobiota bacterium]
MSVLAAPPAADLVARLHQLYHDSSKHSVYQSVPVFVARALGYQEEIHSLWRSDQPRYDYLLARLDLTIGARVADIGANTGYFSLNLARTRPDLAIEAYEMNPRHAEFIRLTAEAFALDRIVVRAESCDLAGLARLPAYDVMLLLNVLHHAGFDFDPQVADTNAAFTAHAIAYLARLRHRCRQLVFQAGSNRGGDKRRPLHAYDDDAARLAWLALVLRESGWQPAHVGYAQVGEGGGIEFRDAPPALLAAMHTGRAAGAEVADFFRAANLARFPGEFHRRPLIIATTI